MSFGEPFTSIFPGPILFNEDYTYTIYYVRTLGFNHVVFTAMRAFSETRYSLGFRYESKQNLKLIMVSPDLSLNESTENQRQVLETGMLSKNQSDQLNTLVRDFTQGVFKTKNGMEIYYGSDAKKRSYSIFGNNCTSVLAAIFPNMVKGLGSCREFANKYLTRIGGTKRKRNIFKKSKKYRSCRRKSNKLSQTF
jgi:hypothetical protein